VKVHFQRQRGKSHNKVNMTYDAKCKRYERKQKIWKETEMEKMKQNKYRNTKIKWRNRNEGKRWKKKAYDVN